MKSISWKKRFLFVLVLSGVMLMMNSVTSAKAATSYDISKKNIEISKSGDYIITGTSDKNSITVNKGVTANITLKNVTMTNEKALIREMEMFDIKSGAIVRLILLGKNSITNSGMGAAIHVPNGAKLAILKSSTGSLYAYGQGGGAGIGGSPNDASGETGSITMNGGTIYAEGGYDSCGIGGGSVSRYDYTNNKQDFIGGGTITINGGKVTAIGSAEGSCAGIGGASLTRQGLIKITGGEVVASSGEAGIGGEAREGLGNIITITGGKVTAYGEVYAAGIGNNMNPDSTIVNISGGTVIARGDYGVRYIYEGYVGDRSEFFDSLKADDIAADKIVITGGDIKAENLSEQPVNSKGIKVYRTYINCKEAQITSITYGDISYGAKDMSSSGYLSMYLPVAYKYLTVKSGDITLIKKKFLPVGVSPLEGIVKIGSMTVDIGEGDVELINGGCIYQNTIYRCDNITITGTTNENRIYIHQNSKGKQNIHFQDVNIDYSETNAEEFIVLDNNVTAIMHLEGTNTFKLGDESRGMFLGHDSALCFTGESEEDALICTTGAKSNVIYTNIASVVQYGGLLKFQLGSNSSAIDTGNYGTFTLCGGKFEAHNEEGTALTGRNCLKVNIYGGTLVADTIGIPETGNEESVNHTLFTMTAGEVIVEERVMFGEYKIYGGNIETRVLGCGTGSDVWMYGGNLEIGTYIDYVNYILETDLMKENIYGGTVHQRNDVPKEEIDKIATDRG